MSVGTSVDSKEDQRINSAKRKQVQKIRNPAAIENQIDQVYLLPSRKPIPTVPAGALLVR